MTNTREHIIWSNIDLDFDDWKEDLMDQYPDKSEYDLIQEMYNLNDMYIDDERANLSVELPHPIFAFADLGLWNGRVTAIKRFGNNISEVLYSECERCKWYVDEKGEFKFTGIHHDGTNYYTYRMLNQDDDWDNIFNEFADRIFEKLPIDDLIEKYTVPIGPYIQNVYGWE